MRKRRPAGELPAAEGVLPPAFPQARKPAALGCGPARRENSRGGGALRAERPAGRSPSGRGIRAWGGGRRVPAGAKVARHARLRPGAAEAPGRQPGPRPRALPAADRRLRHRVLQRRPLGPAPPRLAGGAGRPLPAGGGGAAAAEGPPGRAVAALAAGLPRRRPHPGLPAPPRRRPRAPAAAPLPQAPAAQEAARGPAAGAGGEAAERADRLPPSGGRGRWAGERVEGVWPGSLPWSGLGATPAAASPLQGHLARFLAFGLQLSVTAVEGDARLIAQAAKYDRALEKELEKEQARRQAPGSPPVQGPRHVVGWVSPGTRWPEFVELLHSGKPAGDGRSRGAASTCQPTEPCEPRETEARKGRAEGGAESLEQNPPAHMQAQFPQGALLLTGLHACGDLSATLLRLFVTCPHIVGITSVACCYMKLSTGEGAQPGYPLSDWVAALPGHQLSYKAREGACHAMEDYLLRLEHDSPSLKTHCFRARLETVIRAIDPTKKRLGVQAIPKSHEMTFEQYARRGLERVGMSPIGPLEPASPAQQRRVVVFFSLALLLAPLVETLILLDRMIYVQEQGFPCELVPLFNPALSARNLVLVAAKKVPPSDLWGLAAGD